MQISTFDVSSLIEVMPSILIGRFMINLREASSITSQATGSSMSAARFRMSARRLGNIGEPLRLGDDDDPELPDGEGQESLENEYAGSNTSLTAKSSRSMTCCYDL
ncbi:hypothetical protein PHLGIDRAFT_121773 [Phlebiopsis gigantea 11061_1 CR5-6]|uniref:Uncharacterized protein n=1 Tax=Phlebiopsis gigantea (strain 11061_1 CR5-6) TaxID=745531 RepID=A0A0C3PD91_PHLG1|nr:hypothetical protein PHLGIDRAFT_121773 [Phlebiopsis gigantea 11061_1 CR5-6]